MRPLSWFLAALTLSGCSPEPAAQPAVTILKDGEAIACDDADGCALAGGADEVRVRATYTDLEFEANNHPDPPTLAILIDGAAESSPPAMLEVDGTDLTFESASFRLPPKAAQSLAFRVTGGDGYVAEASGFRIEVADPTIQVSGCGEANCSQFIAGVDKATLEVEAWVPTDTKLTVRSRINGVPQATPSETTFAGSDALPRRAVLGIAVPNVFVAQESTVMWTLEASLPDKTLSPVELTLTPPMVTAAFEECPAMPNMPDTPCTLEPGSTVNLRITVPAGFADTTATVRTFVDTTATGDPFEVDLNLKDAATLVGVRQLTMPAETDTPFIARIYVGDGITHEAKATTSPAGS